MSAYAVLAAGALVGAGMAAVAWWCTPLVPDPLAAAQRRRALADARAIGAVPQPARRWAEALDRAAHHLGLARYKNDLALLAWTPADRLLRKLGYALLGLLFPPLLLTAMALLGLRLPVTVPTLAGIVLAAVLFVVPDVDLRRRAADARQELRHTLWVYLELVALERAGDAGVGAALERAAAVGDSRFFVLVRDELTRTQLTGEPPWRGFERLGDRVAVPELADVCDIMRLTGEDGAAVYGTLRARAASLRGALLNEDAARANATSEHMVVPVALLGLAFLLLLGYPAFARIVFG